MSVPSASRWQQSQVFSRWQHLATTRDSQTSLLQKDAECYVHVLAMSWDEFASRANLDNVDLIKIDVEGAEFDLIPTMSGYLKEAQPALLRKRPARLLCR